MDCSLPGFSIHGIFQARILEWVAISFLQEIFPTQGLNPGLLHYRQTLYHLSHHEPQIQSWILQKTNKTGKAKCKVRELEKVRFRKRRTGTLQEQITFNEARRGSNQICELLHLSDLRAVALIQEKSKYI